MKSLLLLVVILSSGTAALAHEEIDAIVKCHEALNEKSAGRTEKLSLDSATPVALVQGKRLFFLTDSSIYSLENTYRGKDILIHLKEKGQDFYRKMEIRKNGQIGNMSYDQITDTANAIEPKVSLDKESLMLFKQDLLRRVKSTYGEYQTRTDSEAVKKTIDALSACEDIQIDGMKKSVAAQKAVYEKLKQTSYSGKNKKSGDDSGTNGGKK